MERGKLPKPGPALWVLRELMSAPGLPVLSETYYLLDGWLQDPGVTSEGLASVIRQDPALAFNTLRYAAAQGIPVTANLWDTVTAVGVEGVRAMVAGTEVVRGLGSPDHLPFRGLLDHAVNVALAAELLAEADGQDAELAYTAGLLHDVGIMAMLRVTPQTVALAIEHADGPLTGLSVAPPPSSPPLDWSAMLLGAAGAPHSVVEVLTAAAYANNSRRHHPWTRLGSALREAHILCEKHRGAFKWDRLPQAKRDAAFGPERSTAPVEIPSIAPLELH